MLPIIDTLNTLNTLPKVLATVIADSICDTGTRITTFELEYPRIIHSEFMTHRQLSKNSSSSRAIPTKSMLKMVRENAAFPAHWGKNQSGMQAFETNDAMIRIEASELDENGNEVPKILEFTALEWWNMAAESAAMYAEAFADAEYHKQICNRLTEPFQYMKVVCTATQYGNFYTLRIHEMADPTIHMLAVTMYTALMSSTPKKLVAGEWHTPYYQEGFWSELSDGKDSYGSTLDEALAISMSCCAQSSYRKLDDSLEKANSVKTKLNIGEERDGPAHASPTEHQATPMETPAFTMELFKTCGENWRWEDGVTHMTRNGDFWSGNFKHWIQHRQLIVNHDAEEYVP